MEDLPELMRKACITVHLQQCLLSVGEQGWGGLSSQLWGWDKAGLCEKLHRWLLPEHTWCHKLAKSCGHPDSEVGVASKEQD